VKNRKKETNKEKTSKRSNGFQRGVVSILNGTFLTRESVLGNMSFILFASFLMICYISYGYFTERTVRDLQRVDQELKELRSEYITIRSELEKTEQQSKVAQNISALGLKETLEPPRKLEADPAIIKNLPDNGE
jgi:hypothetical protein